MKKNLPKTKIWYKCLVCHTCFQFPKGLIAHRVNSRCRFKYKEIHKERSKRPDIDLVAENLNQQDIKISEQFRQQNKILEPTEQYSNEDEASLKESSQKSINILPNKEHSMNCEVNLLPNPTDQQGVNYSCYFCSSVFTKFEDLKNHTMYHTREKSEPDSFYCEKCKKKFRTSNDLKSHMISKHSITSSVICNLCLKSYSSNSYLKIHVSIIHEGLRPHSCKQCPKNFSTSGHLNTHISTVHEGLKPHCCKQCPKKFGQSTNLRTHISTVHKQLCV